MSQKYDAIVIGGGHNGLICAAYLARAGRKVVVLERRHLVGGAAVTEEIYRGFKYTVCSYVVSLLRPQIIEDLNLPAHGLELLPLNGTLTPMPDGDHLMRWHDAGETRLELMRHSPADAEAYEHFAMLMYHLGMAVRPMLGTTPVDPTSLSPRALRGLADMGLKFGKKADYLYDLAKLMTMSSGDFVEQWFETPALQGTLAASGIIGTFLGPRSPGSAYVMLHHYMGEIDGEFRAWGLPRGGMGGVSEAIASSARSFGAEVRCNAGVGDVIVRNGRARGVALSDGEEIYADTVISSVDPKLTFEHLVDSGELPEEFRRHIARYQIRGSSGKVNLSLDALPRFTCLQHLSEAEQLPYLSGAMSISPNIDHLERAFDDAKYGNFSRRPYMDMTIPSLIDPTLAPPGKHVVSLFCAYAPYDLAEGTWEDQREAFGDAVINTLAQYAPNLKDIILHRQVFTPWDMEQTMGLTEGNIFHGELTLEQLFFLRPAPGYADFTTPLRNMYMCGSGCHPGGGVMGAPGKLAAERIIADTR
ncbi:MAG: FAD-dependent oxidoreductase [Acidobacteria bacterium]|nr:FAD-dependent oxidoreductase [Acidobacteriota bacterium]